MMGIGIGIDYALLMVTRFREWRAAGLDPRGGHRRHPGHRRPGRDGRRQHRGDQHARPVRDGPVVHARRGAGHHPRRPRRDGRQRHAVPRAARLPRPARRPAAAAARPAPRRSRSRWAGTSSPSRGWLRVEPAGRAAPHRRRRRRRGRPAGPGRAVPRRPVRLPRRRQQPRRTTRPGRRTTCWPTAFGAGHERPAAAGRRAARRSGGDAALEQVAGALRSTDRASPPSPPASVNPAGDTAVFTVVPDHRPAGPARPRTWCTRLRDDVLPAATAGTGARRARRRRDGDLDRQHREHRQAASRCSSAAWCCCRCCCCSCRSAASRSRSRPR